MVLYPSYNSFTKVYIALSFTPDSSRLMVRLAGQELLVIAMPGPFIPGPV